MWEQVKKIYTQLILIVFPEVCFGCNKVGPCVCNSCLSNLARPGSEKLPSKEHISALGYEDEVVSKIIWQIKYKGATSLISICGKILGAAIAEYLTKNDIPKSQEIIIIPVPLSKNRRKQRGFNQSELLARATAKNVGGYLLHVENSAIAKIKDTESQTGIKDKRKRQDNQIGAFALLNNDNVKDKFIILVDDVLTTGSTTSECKKILLGGGANKVLIATLAFRHLRYDIINT